MVGTHHVGGVAPGGIVELDPAETNIDALVGGGHIEVVEPDPATVDDETEAAG
ncbi:MAG: hypothetical protein ACRDRL_19120 [Sciscionella sp.]